MDGAFQQMLNSLFAFTFLALLIALLTGWLAGVDMLAFSKEYLVWEGTDWLNARSHGGALGQ